MVKGFACPECGAEVAPEGLSPGRQVRCPDCLTWVEVPFIPRQLAHPRRGRRREGWRAWIPAGLLLVAVVVAVLIGVRIWTGSRAQQRKAIDARIEAAEALEKQKEYGPALAEAEAALEMVRHHGVAPSGGHDDLRKLRAGLARLAAGAQIDSLAGPGADPDESLDAGLSLLARLAADPDLAPLKEDAWEPFAKVRDRWAEAHVEEGNRALDSGRLGEVLAIGERMMAKVATFPSGAEGDEPDQIQALVGRAIARSGVVIAPIQGRFLQGSAAAYDATLRPLLEGHFRRLGYLLPTASSPFRPLWETLAPYRMTVAIDERQAARYLQTPHRTSEIEANLTLTLGGSTAWSEGLTVRTRVPSPMLGAADVRRLSLSTKPDLEIERRLYDDAHAFLNEQIALRLRNLPAPGPTPPAAKP